MQLVTRNIEIWLGKRIAAAFRTNMRKRSFVRLKPDVRFLGCGLFAGGVQFSEATNANMSKKNETVVLL